MPASWKSGAPAITKVVSDWPIPATTPSDSTRCAAFAVSCWSVRPSGAISSTGRPSRPPAALICSTASCAPFSDGPSSEDMPPVRL